jgi:LysM repeat protein
MGIQRALTGAYALGVRSWTDDPGRYTLTLALGGHEMTLMDLVTAYHTIANGGRYLPPVVVETVLDSQSQLIHPLPSWEPIPAISPGAAFQVTDILSDNEARSPMFGANSPLKLSRPAAAKTGTTTSFRDNWTIGFTRYLLAGVWVGNSSGQPMRNTTGISGAAPIWHDFMEAVLNNPEFLQMLDAPEDDPEAWVFAPPRDVEIRPDCPLRLICRKGGEYFTRQWLITSGEAGPLADTFSNEPTVPVHTDRYGNAWAPIYCAKPGGEVRKLLKLTDALKPLVELPVGDSGLTTPSPPTTTVTSDAVTRAADGRMVITFYPDAELERLRRLQWARALGLAVNIGACADLHYYTVQRGDYWSLLAARYSLTLLELQAANPHTMRNDWVLQPGDRLLVPAGIPIKIGQGGQYYTVNEGDSWAEIARQFALPVRLLQTVNLPLVRPHFILQPGDELFVPQIDNPDALR